MNWFEKHLNWTLLILPVVSIISGFMAGFIFHYFSPERTYIVLFPTQPGFFITAILNTVVVIYVLNKKNRDRRFVFFFIFLLVVAVIGQIPIHSELTYSRDNHVLSVAALSGTCLWIIGWITLLFMKKREKQADLGNESRTIRFLHKTNKFFRTHPKILYFSLVFPFVLIVVLGILAGNSYYSNDWTYTVSDGQVNLSLETLYFSFEIPECFIELPAGSPVIFEGLYPSETRINLARPRRKWFRFFTEDYIRIRIGREDSTRFTPDMNIAEKEVVTYYDNSGDTQPPRIIHFTYFRKYGLVWTLKMYSEGRENERNTEFFEHLAESFTISPSETLTEN